MTDIAPPVPSLPPGSEGLPPALLQWHLAQIIVRIEDLKRTQDATQQEVGRIRHAQGDQRQEVVSLAARVDMQTAQQTTELNHKLDAQTAEIARRVDAVAARLNSVEEDGRGRKVTIERLTEATEQLATKAEVQAVGQRVDKLFAWRYMLVGGGVVIGAVWAVLVALLEYAPGWIALAK